MHPPDLNSVTLKVKAVRSSEKSDKSKQSTLCKNPKHDHRFNRYDRKSLKYTGLFKIIVGVLTTCHT
jgi:hypothetical protein